MLNELSASFARVLRFSLRRLHFLQHFFSHPPHQLIHLSLTIFVQGYRVTNLHTYIAAANSHATLSDDIATVEDNDRHDIAPGLDSQMKPSLFEYLEMSVLAPRSLRKNEYGRALLPRK